MPRHDNLLKKFTGFNPTEIDETQWQLGGTTEISGSPLTDGHWIRTNFVPRGERQIKGFDVFGCVTFSYLNALEILYHRIKGKVINFSDRWLYIISGTTENGNNQQTVAEAARKNGLINEADLPCVGNSQEEYADPKIITDELREKAKEFLIETIPLHDWIPSDKHGLLNALGWSPLSIAVEAWYRDENGYYFSPQNTLPNHATTLIDFSLNDYFLILDSYPEDD